MRGGVGIGINEAIRMSVLVTRRLFQTSAVGKGMAWCGFHDWSDTLSI